MKKINFIPFQLSECPESIPESFKNIQIEENYFVVINYCLPVLVYIDNYKNMYDLIKKVWEEYKFYENQLINHELNCLTIEMIIINNYCKKAEGTKIEIFIGS